MSTRKGEFTPVGAIPSNAPPPPPAIGDVWFRRDRSRARVWVCDIYPATESIQARVCIEVVGGARSTLALDEFQRDYEFRGRA